MESVGKPLVRAYLDSGPPPGSMDYTTLVITHGLLWHGANFKKLLPVAARQNIRLIALNWRDYPGSHPYSDEERATLLRLASPSPDSPPSIRDEARDFIRGCAQELYDYMVDLVKRENIPPARGDGAIKQGGIVLAGWSFGGLWSTAFTAYAHTFSSPDVPLDKYVWRVICYDGASGFFGYPSPSNAYMPLWDTTLSPEERSKRFHEWAAAYFPHGDPIEADNLVVHDAPGFRTSLENITAEDLAECTHEPPGRFPDGSDTLIGQLCGVHGLFEELKNAAFYPDSATSAGPDTSQWRNLEFRVVWCDQSIWMMPWAAKHIAMELEEAKRAGKTTRPITLVRVRNANHFAHWDMPEKLLRAFMGDDAEV